MIAPSFELYGLQLRPVEERDAAPILALRLDPDLARFIGETSPDEAQQRRWIAEQRRRAGDYYCACWVGETFVGTVGLYDVSEGHAEWGRWMLRPGTLAATTSALAIYDLAFERLGLERVHCKTIADNQKVVRFHDSCGLERLPANGWIELRGVRRETVVHQLDRANWPRVRSVLEPLAKGAQRFLSAVHK